MRTGHARSSGYIEVLRYLSSKGQDLVPMLGHLRSLLFGAPSHHSALSVFLGQHLHTLTLRPTPIGDRAYLLASAFAFSQPGLQSIIRGFTVQWSYFRLAPVPHLCTTGVPQLTCGLV